MKTILKLTWLVLTTYAKARAATRLTHIGRHDEAKALMLA